MIFGKAALILIVFIVVMWILGRLMRDRTER